ncbi:MAG: SCP2 sterol-binding domain-containing protein, partial [Ostreibacterium sp.]
MFPTLSLSKLFARLINIATSYNKTTDLTPLEGCSFVIAVDELPQDIGIHVAKGKILALSGDEMSQADVTVSGNIKAIINMIQNEGTAFDSDELYIAGKISTAKHFQHFLATLVIDWQSFFSQFMSEKLANKTADALTQGIHFAKGGAEQLKQDFKRYLLEDK